MKKFLFIALLSLFSLTSFSQQTNKKGSYYITWGYNRSAYANSDIRFVGPGYDFTLLNAKALDAPTPLSISTRSLFSKAKFCSPETVRPLIR